LHREVVWCPGRTRRFEVKEWEGRGEKERITREGEYVVDKRL
jgi:hypothetical protein